MRLSKSSVILSGWSHFISRPGGFFKVGKKKKENRFHFRKISPRDLDLCGFSDRWSCSLEAFADAFTACTTQLIDAHTHTHTRTKKRFILILSILSYIGRRIWTAEEEFKTKMSSGGIFFSFHILLLFPFLSFPLWIIKECWKRSCSLPVYILPDLLTGCRRLIHHY